MIGRCGAIEWQAKLQSSFKLDYEKKVMEKVEIISSGENKTSFILQTPSSPIRFDMEYAHGRNFRGCGSDSDDATYWKEYSMDANGNLKLL